MAHHFAGLDLSEADVLRRGMSGKFSLRGISENKDTFLIIVMNEDMIRKLQMKYGDKLKVLLAIRFQRTLGDYAVESYQSLYLKARTLSNLWWA